MPVEGLGFAPPRGRHQQSDAAKIIEDGLRLSSGARRYTVEEKCVNVHYSIRGNKFKFNTVGWSVLAVFDLMNLERWDGALTAAQMSAGSQVWFYFYARPPRGRGGPSRRRRGGGTWIFRKRGPPNAGGAPRTDGRTRGGTFL